MTQPKSSPKKELILSIGVEKPAAEIIAAAKAKGVVISRAYVAKLKESPRGAEPGAPRKKRGRPARSAATPKAAQAVGAQTKADYVRSLGSSVKPAEIVARAKKDGIDVTLSYVYNIRRDAKRAGTKPAGAPARVASSAGKAASPGRAALSGSDAEKALRQAATAVVLAHGLTRAHAVLDDVVARIRAAVGA